jgi:hypothetical protein
MAHAAVAADPSQLESVKHRPRSFLTSSWLKVLASLFGRLFLSDHILTIQAEPPGVDPFDISFFAATVTARNFCVPHLCPLIVITASFMSPPHTHSSLKSVTSPVIQLRGLQAFASGNLIVRTTLHVRRMMRTSHPLKADKHGRHQRRSTH